MIEIHWFGLVTYLLVAAVFGGGIIAILDDVAVQRGRKQARDRK